MRNSSVIEAIVKAAYAATDEQVIQLASEIVQGERAGGTYLQILVARCKAELGKGRKPSPKTQRAVIDRVHGHLYPVVLKGVGDETTSNEECRRRSMFARSSASDLRGFVTRGGDLRALEAGEVSKDSLQKFGQPKAVPAGTRAERAVQKSAASFTKAVQRLAKRDPKKARKRLESALERLQAILITLQPAKRPHRAHVPAARVQGRAHRSRVTPAAEVRVN